MNIENDRNVQDLILYFDTQLQKQIHKKNWFWRVARGYDTFGPCKEVAAVVSSFAGTLFVGGVIFCSAWGSYEMFKACIIALINGERPPADIGHASEWSAQVVLYFYFYIRQLHKIAAEGDYQKMQKIFLKNLDEIECSPADYVELYQYLLQTTSEISRGPIFARSAFKNRVNTIKVIENVQVLENEEELTIPDFSVLREISQEVIKDIEKAKSSKNIFQRSWEGIKSVTKSHGITGSLTAIVTGVAIPAFLGFQSILSFVGTGFAIEDIAKHDEEVAVIGHVGEWPINGFAFAIMAYFLARWSILGEGDLVLCKKILEKHLSKIEDSELRKRYIQASNEELTQLASKCMFSSAPSSYLLKENYA